MRTMIKWRLHVRHNPKHRVVSSCWSGGRMDWTCSCRQRFALHLWSKERFSRS